ncbi:MAG TPA: hypothetical protein VFO11_12695 [Candidatus Polarisedimenticolaceae bacterium]|nr:hypothetical protein [Candidatus Polarisedimenticolaceae bacterium]
MRFFAAIVALHAVVAAGPSAPEVRVRVEPAQTRVAIASVYLELSDLKVETDTLVGSFALRVPLVPSKDDRGTLALPMDAPLEQCLRPGATIRGLASSKTTDRVYPIACAVGADGRVRIAVTTRDRTLEFLSHYTVLSSSHPSSTSRIVRSTASTTAS